MNKLFKISTMVAIAGLVAFNTYMASDILKSNGTDLASVFGLSEVMAEQDDGGETGGGCTGSTPIYCYNGGCSSSTCSVAAGITILGCGVTTGGSASAEDDTKFACCTLRCKSYSKAVYYESDNMADTHMP